MRTNRFKIISKMNTMVYGLPLRLEAIRYNIGLDTPGLKSKKRSRRMLLRFS